MTAPDTVIFNTLEQLVSTDANLVGGLAGKAVGDLVAALIQDPDNNFTVNRPTDGVRRGLAATIGAGLTVDIGAGEIHQLNGATAFNADQSPIEVGRLDTSTNVAVGPADGALPRVTLISCQITQTNTGGSSRNILSLPARTVSVVVVNKRSNPTLTLLATAGTPGANPSVPATPAGHIPLWAVYIPATAAVIAATDLADMRVFFTDWNSAASNGRIEGLWANVDTTVSNVVIRAGRAMIFGVQAVASERTFVATSLFPSGSGAIVANTEYQIYAITAGNGAPVGATIQDKTLFVMTSGNPPIAPGQPTTPITYRPLFDTNAGANSWQITTDRALYLGSLYTDSGASLAINGNGFPQNRVGDHRFKLASNGGLSPASVAVWLKRPPFTYVNAAQVMIGNGCCVLDGMPILFSSITVDMGTDLVSGDAETADTFYYVYVRRAAPAISRADISVVVGRISSEAPNNLNTKPTPEAGFVFSDYIYVGSFLNNGGSDIQEFRRDGGVTMFIPKAPTSAMPNGGQTQGAVVSLNTTAVTFESWLPANSRTSISHFRAVKASTGLVSARIMHQTGNANSFANAAYVLEPPTVSDINQEAQVVGNVVCDASNQFEAFEDTASSVSLIHTQVGYIEDLY